MYEKGKSRYFVTIKTEAPRTFSQTSTSRWVSQRLGWRLPISETISRTSAKLVDGSCLLALSSNALGIFFKRK